MRWAAAGRQVLRAAMPPASVSAGGHLPCGRRTKGVTCRAGRAPSTVAKTIGKIHSIAINDHKVSFMCKPVAESQPAKRFVLDGGQPSMHTLAPVVLAHQSWMLAMLQNAMLQDKVMVLTHDQTRNVTQVELVAAIDFDFDFTNDDDVDNDHPLPGGGLRRPVI